MVNNHDNTRRIAEYYERFDEKERLSNRMGQLEFRRSQELIKRHIPSPPAIVLDIGGAAGKYSCWLAQEGYEVHLIDPIRSLVKQARHASKSQPDFPLASCLIGDARTLPFPDMSVDVILLFGPLYHLIHQRDRAKALSQAYRVLKNKGLLFAVGISRFASAVDALLQGFLTDPEFRKIVDQDLTNGQHKNPTQNISYFTDAFFHHPKELQSEIERAGFSQIELVAIEGLGYMVQNLESYLEEKQLRESLFQILRCIESEPSLIGASPHVMSIARKL